MQLFKKKDKYLNEIFYNDKNKFYAIDIRKNKAGKFTLTLFAKIDDKIDFSKRVFIGVMFQNKIKLFDATFIFDEEKATIMLEAEKLIESDDIPF